MILLKPYLNTKIIDYNKSNWINKIKNNQMKIIIIIIEYYYKLLRKYLVTILITVATVFFFLIYFTKFLQIIIFKIYT